MHSADYQRPDPDSLLAAVQKADSRRRRGRLKIFFGMCAGAGKTYAMLSEARELVAQGIDVVIGYLETHGRAETDALAAGLERIPRRLYEHSGLRLEEMDLDAVLARRPAVALVDELAHTNAPGSRHPRRYLDVLELLEQGVDVFTTINVQHFESQADNVEQLTGVKVYERTPDSMLEMANEIELVDISPDELHARLRAGKVYGVERAQTAEQNFFRRSNLSALREMALSLTARVVGDEIAANQTTGVYRRPFRSRERLLVAIGPNPGAAWLIRLTKRMAAELHADFFALYVNRGASFSQEERRNLDRNLQLAREMGAELLEASDDDLAAAIARVCRQKGVTQIVLGKTPPRGWLHRLVRGPSFSDRLLELCPGVDLHITPDIESELRRANFAPPRARSRPGQYGLAAAAIASSTALNLLFYDPVVYWAPSIIYLFTVTVLGAFAGRGPTLLAATLSALLWNFLFIPPRFTLDVERLEDILMLLLYFVIAAVISSFTIRLRRKQDRLARRESITAHLYDLSRELSAAAGLEGIASAAVRNLQSALDVSVALFFREGDALKEAGAEAARLSLSEQERIVADWSFRNGRPAGRFTDTLAESRCSFRPLLASKGVVGVAGFAFATAPDLTAETMLGALLAQVAVAAEREQFAEQTQRLRVSAESERLHQTVLNTLSHELRTPLTDILGSASALLDDALAADAPRRRALLEGVVESAQRLSRLVNNLLDMSRLESGKLALKRELICLADLIQETAGAWRREHPERALAIKGELATLFVEADYALLGQTVALLLQNAAVHTPAGTQAELRAYAHGDQIVLELADDGPGAPTADLERLFEKFYRAPGAATGGSGLGLALCRAVVELHGGVLSVTPNRPRGLRFILTLPAPDPFRPREAV